MYMLCYSRNGCICVHYYYKVYKTNAINVIPQTHIIAYTPPPHTCTHILVFNMLTQLTSIWEQNGSYLMQIQKGLNAYCV